MDNQTNVANVLSAGMANQTTEAYVARMENFIANYVGVAALVNNTKVTDHASYVQAMTLKGTLSSLVCYTLNNDHALFTTFHSLEMSLGQKLFKYSKSQLALPNENRMIRYILSNRKMRDDEDMRKKILDHLVSKNLVFRLDGNIVVTGIHCKVGDNVFSRDMRGGSHRQYVNVCCLQCFELQWSQDILYLEGRELPEISDEYSLTWFGDGKGSARHPKFNRKELLNIQTTLSHSYQNPQGQLGI